MTHPAVKNVVRSDVPFDDPIPPEAKDLDLIVMNVIYHDGIRAAPEVEREFGVQFTPFDELLL